MTDEQNQPELPPVGAQEHGQQAQLFPDAWQHDEPGLEAEHEAQNAGESVEQTQDGEANLYAALQTASREMEAGEDDYADYEQYLDQVAMENEAAEAAAAENAEDGGEDIATQSDDEAVEEASDADEKAEVDESDKIDWSNDSAERILEAMAPVLLEDAWRHEERQAIARQRLSGGANNSDSGGATENYKPSIRGAIATSIMNRGLAKAEKTLLSAAGARPVQSSTFRDAPATNAGRDHLAVHAHTAMASITDQVNAWKAASAAGDAEKKKEAIAGIQKSFDRLGELTAAKSSVDRNVGAGALAQVQSACAARDIIRDGCKKLMDDPSLKGHEDINKALAEGAASFFDKLKEVFKNIVGPALRMLGIRNGVTSNEKLEGRVEPSVGAGAATSSPKMG